VEHAATYRGPKLKLRISATGTVLRRGEEAAVTAEEADLLRASSADVEVVSFSEYDGLTVAELRGLCRAEDLPTSGTKAELIDRLS
jgi:hypothetical protein